MTKKQLFARSIASVALASTSTAALAQSQDQEETEEQAGAQPQLNQIVVTARKAEESLQDVPVTVTAVGSETLDKLGIDNSAELETVVPSLQISQGGPASGATITIRGVGASAASSAFDTAVAFNIDGVQSNNGRVLFAGLFDLQQVEVLKGPQSLYFGKGASAGVITLTSNDPGSSFEAGLTAGYEFEERTKKIEGFVSGPITDTLGARLAVRYSDTDRVSRNSAGPHNIGSSSGNFTLPPALGGLTVPQFLAPSTRTPVNEYRGESSLDARLTLVWEPTDALRLEAKGLISRYENDGVLALVDVTCVTPGTPQPTAPAFQFTPGVPAIIVPSNIDCNGRDGVIQVGDATDAFNFGNTGPEFNGGVPFDETDTDLVSLTIDYDVADGLTLTSVTGYLVTDNIGLETFNFDNNAVTTALARNRKENFSQELRLASDFGGAFDFSAGLFYQERSILFDTQQFALGAPLFLGPDPVTGQTLDWRLVFDTDVEAISGFLNLTIRPSDTVEITAGARYSEEDHFMDFSLPYIHAFLAPPNFIPSGTTINDITFSDDDISPEVTISWQAADDVKLFAAYKTGFKSGGVDNAALPTGGFSAATAPGLLVFGSETAEGFEIGMKSDLADNSLRFNATGFFYIYEDLQVQQFSQAQFNTETFNAGQLETIGIELETVWATPVDGLTLSGALAYTDTKYTEPFVITGVTGANDDLNGLQLQNNSRWTANGAATYEADLTDSLIFDLSLFANYRSSFRTGIPSGSPVQDGFAKLDATIGIGGADESWRISLIGNNLTDKRTYGTAFSNGRVGAIPPVAGGPLDQTVTFSRGRQISVQFELDFF